jgi:hypothetical protein
MHHITSGRDLVQEVFEGKWRGNNLPMWTFVLPEPCSTRLAHQGSFLPLSSEEALSFKRILNQRQTRQIQSVLHDVVIVVVILALFIFLQVVK